MSDEPNTRSPSPGLLMIISGPSGVGKTTLIERLNEKFDFTFSVSATTRQRTEHETDGIDYYFLDEPTFKQWVDEDKFLEHACVFGRYWYGTPRQPIEKNMAEGRIVLLDIDVQGARLVKAEEPDTFSVFILPPSEEALHKRLVDRGRENAEIIERRFSEAKSEIKSAYELGIYDAMVTNDDLDRAADELDHLLEARLRRAARSGPATSR
ncbi:MAG: guanylate kinase [Planctomycetaceae bacterium]|nr:guanylate kinase [Planctomycetaceae bacterium]